MGHSVVRRLDCYFSLMDIKFVFLMTDTQVRLGTVERARSDEREDSDYLRQLRDMDWDASVTTDLDLSHQVETQESFKRPPDSALVPSVSTRRVRGDAQVDMSNPRSTRRPSSAGGAGRGENQVVHNGRKGAGRGGPRGQETLVGRGRSPGGANDQRPLVAAAERNIHSRQSHLRLRQPSSTSRTSGTPIVPAKFCRHTVSSSAKNVVVN